jgi:O-methyltransferase involved in polyketide biosynthesis
MLNAGSFAQPARLTYVPVDFERQELAAELLAAGFDPARPAVFAWLGVSMYLTQEAFRATAGFVAGLARGTGLIFDYALPRASLSPEEQAARDALMVRVAAVGEPFRLAFTPGEMAAELGAFARTEDLDGAALNARYFAGRSDALAVWGQASHVVSAWC